MLLFLVFGVTAALRNLAVENLKAKILTQDGITSKPAVLEEMPLILSQPGMQVLPLPSQLLRNSQLSVPSSDSPLLFVRNDPANSVSSDPHVRDALLQTEQKLRKEVEFLGLPLRIWISAAIYLGLTGFAGVAFSRKPVEAVMKLILLVTSTIAFLVVIHDHRENGVWRWKLLVGVVLIFGFLIWNIIDMIYLLQGPLYTANDYFKDIHWESFKRHREVRIDDPDNVLKSSKQNKNENWSDINNRLVDALNDESNNKEQEQEPVEEEDEEQDDEQEREQEQGQGGQVQEIDQVPPQYDLLQLNLPSSIPDQELEKTM